MAVRMLRKGLAWAFVISLAALATAADRFGSVVAPSGWRQHDVSRPKPPVAEPAPETGPTKAPADATVLFDGKGLDAWQSPEGGTPGWAVKHGHFEVTPGAGPIQTKARFGDVQLHVEWAAPDPPGGVGQDRGNSGIFLMGQFELQVLDSYRADTYADGQAGALYGQYPPLFNATRPPGQWQAYDVAFRRPRFDAAGKLTSPAKMTVFLNGVLVQDNEELWGQTSWLEPVPFDPKATEGPIQLQDHGHPVRFRNIWIRPIPERASPRGEQSERFAAAGLSREQLDAFTGLYAAGPPAKDFRVRIRRDDDHLVMSLPFRPAPLHPVAVSETELVLPHTDARLTFTKAAAGRMIRCEFRVGDGSRTLTRLDR